MRSILLSLLLCFSGVAAVNAEEFYVEKPLPCDTFPVIMQTLTVKYKETPIAMLESPNDKTFTLLLVNFETASWTTLESDGKNACVLSFGQGFKFSNDLLKRMGKTV